ncbi:MAG TPA: NAD-dependent epimerase/dehydratase family protein [Mycobacteriales bacterium]|nr:NAD-dependent epimerase/dehydratase family protein [Mycobacteriales bacterium]
MSPDNTSSNPPADLTVAVTGPTGTFGFGLMPLLQDDDRVGKIVGIARRPFDPGEHGWTKMEYRRGDVRDEAVLKEAFTGADVVVHLAFLIIGGNKETTRAINVEGTLNVFRAAAAAGVERFVYASSVAAYGFHADNPVGMTEDWPTRPAERLFYAQEKAELEALLQEEAAAHPELALYLLRPPVVLGPHTLGAKELPGPFGPLSRRFNGRLPKTPIPFPVLVPDHPLQFIHEDDVGQALLQCVVGAGPPGAYNIAGDGVLSMVDVARELGLRPVKISAAPTQLAARMVSKVPWMPSFVSWVEAMSHPAVMDTTRAKTELGWTPRYTGIEALRDTLR